MDQYLLCTDPSCANCPLKMPHEPFSIRSASGQRVSILNPDPDSPPPIVDPSALAGPSIHVVRITKTYRCASCPKVFTSSGHLQRHGRVHSGEKQFTCPFPDCHKQCNRQDNLLQHYKIHLPRSERNRGPEYLNMVFTEMVSSMAARGRVRPKPEPQSNGNSPIEARSASLTATSPTINSDDLSSLHILASSALDSLPRAPESPNTSASPINRSMKA